MSQKRKCRAVILAAGKGTRMTGRVPKLLVEIHGKPIIKRVVEACQIPEVEKTYVVVGHRAGLTRDVLGDSCTFVTQRLQLGTAHALLQVRRRLENFRGDLLVVVGDSPFLTRPLLRRLLRAHRRSGSAATFLTTEYPQPPPYARVIRDARGKVANLLEENQCTPEQKLIKEVSTTHYCFRSEIVLPLLSEIRKDNPKREYYLTDIIPILLRHSYEVRAVRVKNPRLVFGINDLRDLQWAKKSVHSSS